MPFWGPKHSKFEAPIEHGQVVQGAVAAFKLEESAGKLQLTPAWISRNMWQADPVVIANGVVFAYGNGEDAAQSTYDIGLAYNTAVNRIANSSHATLYALDARTGDELWSSGDQITSFSHFSSLAVANGRVYLGTFDGTLYCFGVSSAGTE
jgi:outer membrane protein assembly factor BamB